MKYSLDTADKGNFNLGDSEITNIFIVHVYYYRVYMTDIIMTHFSTPNTVTGKKVNKITRSINKYNDVTGPNISVYCNRSKLTRDAKI